MRSKLLGVGSRYLIRILYLEDKSFIIFEKLLKISYVYMATSQYGSTRRPFVLFLYSTSREPLTPSSILGWGRHLYGKFHDISDVRDEKFKFVDLFYRPFSHKMWSTARVIIFWHRFVRATAYFLRPAVFSKSTLFGSAVYG